MQPFFYLHKPFFKIFCCCRYLVMTKWQFLFAAMHSFFTKAIYSKPVFYLFSIKVSQKIMRPLKNGADNNYLPFQDHFCLKKGNYRG